MPTLPSIPSLRDHLRRVVVDLTEQGHATDGIDFPDTYDELVELARRLRHLPLRDDWPYVEPDDFDAIRAEWREVPSPVECDAADRIRAAFRARVAGCMLGKPFEIGASFEMIKEALEQTDGWPLRDYPSEAAVRALPTLQGQWRELVRERLAHVVPDDDINYTILAMLVLERHGAAFTHEDLRALWLFNLPVAATFGPERATLLELGVATLGDVERLPAAGAELCGALIRADAYGYACPGNPARAAELAHRDASLTHSRTGVYGAMFVAAAIALALSGVDTLDIFRGASAFVPQRSRFAEAVRGSIEDVEHAKDWTDGFERVRLRHGEYGFCRIHQELGTVMNTVRFAADAGDGICKQVMQGNDTDSFGATAGSILGAHLGEIDERWIAPFENDVHTALASFHERSLQRITERMAVLPDQVG